MKLETHDRPILLSPSISLPDTLRTVEVRVVDKGTHNACIEASSSIYC